jgi:m7GpppX diphosphatase
MGMSECRLESHAVTGRGPRAEFRLVLETPEMHESKPMQAYISREVCKPSKQWIHEVLSSRREADRVKLRTESLVLLPDVNSFPKRSKDVTWQDARWRLKRPQSSFHWLAVVTDTRIHTLRDLRGEHLPMLAALYTDCCQKIRDETGYGPEQIMAFVHYPPSVYQLHVHFKYPLNQSASAIDAFRMHSLPKIMNNLRSDGDYYRKAHIELPVYTNTELYTALGQKAEDSDGTSDSDGRDSDDS